MRLAAFLAIFFSLSAVAKMEIAIGSKAFTEGMVLSEMAAQVLESSGEVKIKRRFGMGGTGILFEALGKNEIQLYPEYTGTISEAILKNPDIRTHKDLDQALRKMGLTISQPLGFNNTYAIAVSKDFAVRNNLRRISDLRNLPEHTRIGFSHEFMTRADGYRALSQAYQLRNFKNVRSLEHSLAYEAIAKREIDVLDAYSTDAKIEKLDLIVLEDDLNFFPKYEAVFLARIDFVNKYPELWQKLTNLEGKLSASLMIKLNSQVDIDKKDRGKVVADYFGQNYGEIEGPMKRVVRRTKEHFALVGIAFLISTLFGIPLGIMAYRQARMGQGILLFSGVVQTIPSLALLCFLIPLFGIGEVPALVALCLYGLLPVVTNTFVGLRSIDAQYLEVCRALGLNFYQQLRLILLPMASRTIIAGLKNSFITSIGTATLAALIGAGGYGVSIVTGLAINDMRTILYGAIPAAVMAVLAHLVFVLVEKKLIPKGV